MLKVAGTREVFGRMKTKERKKESSTKPEVMNGLDSPKTISLDDLRALLPVESDGSSSTSDSLQSKSLEKLKELLPFGTSSLESPTEIDLDDLRELLEPCGVVTREEVEVHTRDLLAPDSTIEDKSTKFRIWKIIPGEICNSNESLLTTTVLPLPLTSCRQLFSISTQSLDIPRFEPKDSSKLNKISKCKSIELLVPSTTTTPVVPIPTKVKIVSKPEDKGVNGEKLNTPEAFLKKLQELSEGDNLEKWIESLNLPKELDLPQIREQIKKFLKEKSWKKRGGLRYGKLDGSLAKNIWAWFKDLSIAKQILVVIGLSIVIAAIGFLTMQLFALIWPSLLGVATSGESALREIGVEAFKQRQEPAFHLLHIHAEQAKPFSYAWANQYVLWKYCR